MQFEDISFLWVLAYTLYSALGAVFSALMRYIKWCFTYFTYIPIWNNGALGCFEDSHPQQEEQQDE